MSSSSNSPRTQRKSCQFEENPQRRYRRNTKTHFKTESSESSAYEIVPNETDDVEQQQDEMRRGVAEVNVVKRPAFKSDFNGKLKISLNSEKIALKSQSAARINKSIAVNVTEIKQSGERETNVKTTSQGIRHQHAPIAFSIAPLNVARRTQASTVATVVTTIPEISLTSYDEERNAKAPVTIKANSVLNKKSVTETLRNTTTAHRISRSSQQQQHTAIAIKPLTPPPEVLKRANNCGAGKKFKNTAGVKRVEAGAATEVGDKLRDSEVNSSTSPESLMDNVRSAASSTSVRSSSLSSTNTDMTMTQLAVTSATVTIDGGSGGGTISTARENASTSGFFAAAVTTELHANRVLNLKSPEPKVSLPDFLQSSPTSSVLSHLNEASALLQPPEAYIETSSMQSRSPSSLSIRIIPDIGTFPDELKCPICMDLFRDPRTLNCLHSFCFQCIINENFQHDTSLLPFWSQPAAEESDDTDWKSPTKHSYSLRSMSPEPSMRSLSDNQTSPSRPRRSSFSFRRKKSLERILLKPKTDGKCTSESSSTLRLSTTPPQNISEDYKGRTINCKICNFMTELPLGGFRQLPQNLVLVRKIEDLKLKMGDEVISQVWCSLCYDETNATYHCLTCTMNLCTLCKEAHGRQRNTSNHKIRNIMELRRARNQKQSMLGDNSKFVLKCIMHPGFEMKSFCINCLQIACTDCLILLHKGHKHELIGKAVSAYGKLLRDSMEQTRPLCNYAEHSIERLNEIAKGINKKCDNVQVDVETYMNQYFEAVEVHRKTLLQQLQRARESKIEIILEQQLDLEKQTNEAMEVVRFCQELSEVASDVEILSFVNILLKRFEYCQQFKAPIDPKISDSLHFLPKIRAPATKTQNDIPLFGIITMQTVEPSLCTLQWEGFSQLRLHKKVELMMQSRDADGVPLCHGGLQPHVGLKYKEYSTKFLPLEISDHRDGTYGIAFTPDSQGTILLTVTINDKPIKGSPFTFLARTVSPHHGIYHCCTFCSSKGNKTVKCFCEGRMPGFNGCGHGHTGHPGRRHWSCCGNVLENSECNVANKLLNS